MDYGPPGASQWQGHGPVNPSGSRRVWIIVAIVGGVVVLLAVVFLVLFLRVNDEVDSIVQQGQGSGEGTTSTYNTLVSQLPSQAIGCEEASTDVDGPGAIAVASCNVPGPTGNDPNLITPKPLVFYLFADVTAEQAAYDAAVARWSATRDTGSCTSGAVGETFWSVNGEEAGRLLCAIGTDGVPILYWSSHRTPILARLQGASSVDTQEGLYAVWQTIDDYA